MQRRVGRFETQAVCELGQTLVGLGSQLVYLRAGKNRLFHLQAPVLRLVRLEVVSMGQANKLVVVSQPADYSSTDEQHHTGANQPGS